LQKHLEFTGEDVELVPRDVDASNDDVIEHGFHKDVNHANVLRCQCWLDNIDDIVELGIFVGDSLTVEASVFGVVLVVNWNKD
jgi:hypothetical protein